jgi:hypothetical protein
MDNIYNDYYIFIHKFINSPVKNRKNMINNISHFIKNKDIIILINNINVYSIDNQPYNINDIMKYIYKLNYEQVHNAFSLWVNTSL